MTLRNARYNDEDEDVTYYVPQYLNLHQHCSKNITSGIMLDLMKINITYNSFISRKQKIKVDFRI